MSEKLFDSIKESLCLTTALMRLSAWVQTCVWSNHFLHTVPYYVGMEHAISTVKITTPPPPPINYSSSTTTTPTQLTFHKCFPAERRGHCHEADLCARACDPAKYLGNLHSSSLCWTQLSGCRIANSENAFCAVREMWPLHCWFPCWRWS